MGLGFGGRTTTFSSLRSQVRSPPPVAGPSNATAGPSSTTATAASTTEAEASPISETNSRAQTPMSSTFSFLTILS